MTDSKKKISVGEHFFSTGIRSLDGVLNGLVRGDNVVWQLEHIEDYVYFLLPYCRYCNENNIPLVYFRFAQHRQLLPDNVNFDEYELDAQAGFEQFVSEIFTVIEEYGKGACYVFDCISELSVDWYSDRMLGNFFMLVCPYLFEYDTIAYFMLDKKRHTPLAVEAIHQTAQVVLDVFRSGEERFLQPIKVENVNSPGRSSSIMYSLHRCGGEEISPVTKSSIISDILSKVPQPWLDFSVDRRDIWAETFMEARKMNEEVYRNMRIPGRIDSIKSQIIKMILTQDESLYELCLRHFSLEDLISIGKRMVGTGLIGGKSAGMLLSRAILEAENPEWGQKMETHDSFFIGSDVFYTYIIRNGCWWDRRKLKSPPLDFDRADEIRKNILKGVFPDDILEQFREMLNYFGQSPIIVRSSSLLEDAYGNAFSGKYESVFCSNQGTPEDRMDEFVKAVREVYASTMNVDALSYRMHRGLLGKDEQMALLVQRVSGAGYNGFYFPHIAGVGYSFNPFVWNSRIDPASGVLRLVFGLGTHAVDRVGDDYTRIIALNEPMLRPDENVDGVQKYTQRQVDLVDLKKGLSRRTFEKIVKSNPDLPLEIFAEKNEVIEKRARELKLKGVFSYMLSFETLLTDTGFVSDMREILRVLEEAYKHPVDIEFCANFESKDQYKINLLQCRPFQIARNTGKIEKVSGVKAKDIIIKSPGPIIGQSMFSQIDRLIYIDPAFYGELSNADRSIVARIVGELGNSAAETEKIMLAGPGRWGTTMPSLGIPVSFNEIKRAAVLCELVTMHQGLTPDVSLGTHFFNDLVEMNIRYMALQPQSKNSVINYELLEKADNRLSDYKPERAKKWGEMIYVLDAGSFGAEAIHIHVDSIKQKAIVYLA